MIDRISFMNDHINSIMNAVDKGVDVRGYYAWSSFEFVFMEKWRRKKI